MELDPLALRGRLNGRYVPDWYSYAAGNPFTRTDRKGLETSDVQKCRDDCEGAYIMCLVTGGVICSAAPGVCHIGAAVCCSAAYLLCLDYCRRGEEQRCTDFPDYYPGCKAG